ncbi:hypothetical protein T296_09105 [Pantoea agglomerans Eh318]|nr:hypothetical protein T296_09105 [Pantoea agglomerans Eh318]
MIRLMLALAPVKASMEVTMVAAAVMEATIFMQGRIAVLYPLG